VAGYVVDVLWLGTWWMFCDWVRGGCSSGGKEAGPKTDDSPPSSAEVRNYRSFSSTPTHNLCYLISQLLLLKAMKF
jgi:hypothetical protein